MKQLSSKIKSNRDKMPRSRLAIRHYVYGLQARFGGESYRLPSSRELAAQFGLARCTVTRELEQLVREGILVTRQGVGTFLAPIQKEDGFRKSRVVGIISGAGNYYHYDEYHWMLISATGNSLIEHECLVRPVTIWATGEEKILRELRENFLDALIWLSPPSDKLTIVRRIARELPTVVLGPQWPEECSSVTVDYAGESYREGKLLQQEGRRNFWAAMTGQSGEVYLTGFRRAWEEAGIPFDERTIFNAPVTLPPEFREALQAGKRPDIFFIHTQLRAETIRLLQEFQVDFKQECRLICGSAAAKIPGFAGWCHEQPYQEIGEIATKMIIRQLDGDGSVEHLLASTRRLSINL